MKIFGLGAWFLSFSKNFQLFIATAKWAKNWYTGVILGEELIFGILFSIKNFLLYCEAQLIAKQLNKVIEIPCRAGVRVTQ